VTCQQLRLVFGDFGELPFEKIGNTSVKGASWLAQQRSVGRVLHERVLEQ
jgi:hypothetical protein